MDVSGVDYGDTTLYDKFGVWEPKSLTGGLAYQQLSSKVGKVKASELLKAAGIPGIKYFDQGSRAAGEGTRNFVIFDPDIAKILKRE